MSNNAHDKAAGCMLVFLRWALLPFLCVSIWILIDELQINQFYKEIISSVPFIGDRLRIGDYHLPVVFVDSLFSGLVSKIIVGVLERIYVNYRGTKSAKAEFEEADKLF